jgi:hypothetical protein
MRGAAGSRADADEGDAYGELLQITDTEKGDGHNASTAGYKAHHVES